uniref:HAT C-terminal dimerisation domain-containing protein n=1 Tax=Pelusios castaneus TaxID=367368 RepID=A0A8C8RAN0_9SAUR
MENLGLILEENWGGIVEESQRKLNREEEKIPGKKKKVQILSAVVLDCYRLLTARQESDIVMPSSVKELLESIIMYDKDVFPEVQISLVLLLTLAISVASCKWAFSKLKIIKNYLLSTLKQERLLNLALLSIKRTVFESVSVDSVIGKFAEIKLPWAPTHFVRCILL